MQRKREAVFKGMDVDWFGPALWYSMLNTGSLSLNPFWILICILNHVGVWFSLPALCKVYHVSYCPIFAHISIEADTQWHDMHTKHTHVHTDVSLLIYRLFTVRQQAMPYHRKASSPNGLKRTRTALHPGTVWQLSNQGQQKKTGKGTPITYCIMHCNKLRTPQQGGMEDCQSFCLRPKSAS